MERLAGQQQNCSSRLDVYGFHDPRFDMCVVFWGDLTRLRHAHVASGEPSHRRMCPGWLWIVYVIGLCNLDSAIWTVQSGLCNLIVYLKRP